MPKAADPSPEKKVLLAGGNSKMQFMAEESLHDSEADSYVRFRGNFIVPSWDGVEQNEIEYVIDSSSERIDRLADRFYDDVSLGWVIAIRNHMDLPDVQLYKGRRIKVPKKDWIETVLIPQGRTIRSAN